MLQHTNQDVADAHAIDCDGRFILSRILSTVPHYLCYSSTPLKASDGQDLRFEDKDDLGLEDKDLWSEDKDKDL